MNVRSLGKRRAKKNFAIKKCYLQWKNVMLLYLPAPNGILDDVVLFFSLDSVFSPSLLASTVIWLLTDVVLTTFGVAVVSVQVVVVFWLLAALLPPPTPLPAWLLRNSKIDGDLSMRLSVCNKIGPSLVPFLFNRCCNIIEPSGMVVAVAVAVEWLLAVDTTDVNVVAEAAFDAVAFFNVCVECSNVALVLIPLPFNVDASMIWLVFGFFSADWITNLFVSVDNFDVVDTVFLCNKIDGEFDVLHVIFSSSLLLMLTAPLFNKLNKSWPFCRIICPFSVRAPRIKIILLAGCCCYDEIVRNGTWIRVFFFNLVNETHLLCINIGCRNRCNR